MKLIIDRHRESKNITLDEVRYLEIWVSEDKCFRAHINNFGELEVNKQTYNEESSTIIIKPSVSNNINLI